VRLVSQKECPSEEIEGAFMSPNTEQLLTTVLELPAEDRLEFTEALIASLRPTDQPPFDPSWREIIHRRSAELRSGQVTPVTWEEVKRRLREKSGG
jgi:putative addiction module component (TIGR02574 family)